MRTPFHLFSEEGRTRSKNAARRIRFYVLVAAIAALVGGYGYQHYWAHARLTPLQRVYFGEYQWSTWRSYFPKWESKYATLNAIVRDPVTNRDLKLSPVDENIEPVLDGDGRVQLDEFKHPIFRLRPGVEAKRLYWSEDTYNDRRMYLWLRGSIYDGRTVLEIWEPAFAVGILIFCLLLLLLAGGDFIYNRRFLKGEQIRGTSLISLSNYQREHRKDQGYRIKVYKSLAKKWIAKLLLIAGFSAKAYWLSVPLKEETEGLLLLGDPGTGKSQVLHQVLVEIARRKPSEAVVCHDPEGEFVKNHADEKHDTIFNPFDKRCPFWSPTLEVNYDNPLAGAADRKMIAEAFFPYRRFGATHSDFFIDATRFIFGRILEVERDLTRIIEILTKEELIDQIVAGTEHAHLINPGAKGQRGGVLATLSEIGESLKLLPTREQCTKTLSLTEWAKRRKGWIFITSKQDTRDATRRLYAAMINILMKRLLAADPDWAGNNPCWLVIDEVHALGHLSALPIVIVEGRKHGLKIAAATQNKAQIEEQYGRNSATMLAAFHTKGFFRCNEPESARWVSDLIGDEEKEKPRMGTTASVQRFGRDSINYTTMTELRPVVSKEEIMSLANLHGYWKHEKLVVLFRVRPLIFRNTVQSFIERKSPPTVSRISDELQITVPHENGKETHEIAPTGLEEIDITF